MSKRIDWLPEEDAVLISRWASEGAAGCYMLARRSKKGMEQRARRLGVQTTPEKREELKLAGHRRKCLQRHIERVLAKQKAKEAEKPVQKVVPDMRGKVRTDRHDRYMRAKGGSARPTIPRVASIFHLGAFYAKT